MVAIACVNVVALWKRRKIRRRRFASLTLWINIVVLIVILVPVSVNSIIYDLSDPGNDPLKLMDQMYRSMDSAVWVFLSAVTLAFCGILTIIALFRRTPDINTK